MMMAFVLSKLAIRQAAFVTLLDFRQFVQTVIRRVRPLTFARTSCRFGIQRLRVRLCACEMLLPEIGFLPQISHTRAISSPRLKNQINITNRVHRSKVFHRLC